MAFRNSISSYLHLLTGFAGRVVLQGVYFLVLANKLSLADFGVFASCVAAALVLASGGSFGWSAPLFRAGVARRRLIGAYLGGFYVYVLLGLPLVFGLAALVHVVALESFIGFWAFMAIVAAETICWRLVEAISSLNSALGRFARGSAAAIGATGFRTGAALVLLALDAPTLDTWAALYLAANVAAATVCVVGFQPRVRLAWSPSVFLGRLPESLSFSAANLLQALQSEADKLLVLFLAGQSAAGIYAVSMRVIELAVIPLKSFLSLHVQSLIQRRSAAWDGARAARVEAVVALAAVALFGILIAALSIRPGLIGSNVAQAYGWFAGLWLVGPARMLVEYHRILFFATNRIFDFAKISLAMFAVKAPAMAAIALLATTETSWALALNGVFVLLFVVSAVMTRAMLARDGRPDTQGFRLPAALAARLRSVATAPLLRPRSRPLRPAPGRSSP